MSQTSTELFAKAKTRIPGGVNSPVRSFKHVGGNPVYFERAEGAFLYDTEGKDYIDFCLAFGPHLLGHSPKRVVQAIQTQAAKATSFGACHTLEPVMAERILEAFPFLQQVRLVNSGTEAVMTAVRLARGATKRNKIVMFEGCYHGHSDGLLAKAGSGVAELAGASSEGVPPSVVADTLVIRWDEPGALSRVFREFPGQIAAVLLEPIPANNGLQVTDRATLSQILQTAHQHGALVIFDEVITGFRLGYSGASGYFDLKPDLVTLGKVVGGGLPLAAVVGKQNLMQCLAPVGGVYQAGTLAGNPLAIAAGLAVLDELQSSPPYQELAQRTEWFTKQLEPVWSGFSKHCLRRVGSVFWVLFDAKIENFPPEITSAAKSAYVEFFKFALERGVYFPPSPYEVSFLSSAHTPDVLSEAVMRLTKG